MLINQLIPAGFKGLVLVGILSSVMSTISAFLNSISTLFTFGIYKKWMRKDAKDKELVAVGTIATLALMAFGVLYSRHIGEMGGIFKYFQAGAAYLAVPVATVFLFGIFWKRSTPAAAITILIVGIPMGFVVSVMLGGVNLTPALSWIQAHVPFNTSQTIRWLQAQLPILPQNIVNKYSLDNFFIGAGITQVFCMALMFVITLFTKPRKTEEIAPLLWSKEKLRLPKGETRKVWYKSVQFWWILFVVFYVIVIIYLR